MVNTCIVYNIHLWPFPECADFASGNFLFGACELTKISDSDKYSYSKYV